MPSRSSRVIMILVLSGGPQLRHHQIRILASSVTSQSLRLTAGGTERTSHTTQPHGQVGGFWCKVIFIKSSRRRGRADPIAMACISFIDWESQHHRIRPGSAASSHPQRLLARALQGGKGNGARNRRHCSAFVEWPARAPAGERLIGQWLEGTSVSH